MIQRLLLDRIDAESARSAVAGEHHIAATRFSDEAEATLPVLHLAVPRAQVALDSSPFDGTPPAGRGWANHVSLLAHGPMVAEVAARSVAAGFPTADQR